MTRFIHRLILAKLLVTGEVPVPIYTTGVNIGVAKPRVKHQPTTITKEFEKKLVVVKNTIIKLSKNTTSTLNIYLNLRKVGGGGGV